MKFTIYQESRPGKRPNNEDRLAHCYSRDALLTVVADGMGGHYYGEIAAQIAVQTLVESFQREATPTIEDPFMFLHRAMMNAHRAIVDFSTMHRLNDSPRTTCVACIVQQNVAYWGHSGDSRLYLMRNGRVFTHTARSSISPPCTASTIRRARPVWPASFSRTSPTGAIPAIHDCI